MKTISEIIEEIKANGICSIDSFLLPEEIQKMRNELSSFYDSIPHGAQYADSSPVQKGAYLAGKALVFRNPGSIPYCNSVFERDFFKDLATGYLGGNCQRNLQTFSTYEDRVIERSEWPRNLFFHFDPYRALKFFFYLDDTTEENGAFRAIPGSHHQCRSVREKTDLQTLLNEKYLISQHPELSNLSEKDAIFFPGRAGTLLIFDTDIAHTGGIIKREGAKRMVILNHNR